MVKVHVKRLKTLCDGNGSKQAQSWQLNLMRRVVQETLAQHSEYQLLGPDDLDADKEWDELYKMVCGAEDVSAKLNERRLLPATEAQRKGYQADGG